jgi:hypothetical protein
VEEAPNEKGQNGQFLGPYGALVLPIIWIEIRQRLEGYTMLYNDYFSDSATHADNFWRRLRMSKELFMEILHGMREFDPYFKLKHDAVGTACFSSIQKCTAAMMIFAYGAPANA